MGTRSAVGFRRNGVDKVMYNQFDGYPESMGELFVDYLKSTTVDFKELFDKIRMVNDRDVPSKEEFQYLWNKLNGLMSDKEKEINKYVFEPERASQEYYALLRPLQSNFPLLEKIKVMTDDREFLKDSLFCEFAYIYNIDTSKLEFYTGFNKDPEAKGRYAKLGVEGEYKGVALQKEYPFPKLLITPTEDIVNDMVELSKRD